MNLISHRVNRGERQLDLTPREYDLLAYLLEHQGVVVSREMLAQDVWQIKERSTPLDNVIDVSITRLRRKIDGAHEQKLIRTVRGVGFSICSDPS